LTTTTKIIGFKFIFIFLTKLWHSSSVYHYNTTIFFMKKTQIKFFIKPTNLGYVIGSITTSIFCDVHFKNLKQEIRDVIPNP
jgi:hypothetical protein